MMARDEFVSRVWRVLSRILSDSNGFATEIWTKLPKSLSNLIPNATHELLKDAHLDELMDGLDEAQKPVVLSDSEPSDGMQSESDDEYGDGREVVDLSDGEYRAPGEYVPVANKKKSENSSKKPSATPVDPLSASFADAKKLYYDKLKVKNKVAVAAPLPKPLFAVANFFTDFDQGEPELDSDCEIAQDWELAGEKKKKKCRVKLEVLSESKLEKLLMTPDEVPETIVTAPIRRVPVGSRFGHDGVTTMLGQKLKIKRRPTKQEEKAAAAVEATKQEVKEEPEALPVEAGDQAPERPVRSTRGQNKKYDDGDFKEGEFSDKMSESDDDDDAPLRDPIQ